MGTVRGVVRSGRKPDDGQWFLATVYVEFSRRGPLNPTSDEEWTLRLAQTLIRDDTVATVRISIGRSPSVYRADVWASTRAEAATLAAAPAKAVAERMGVDTAVVECELMDAAQLRDFEQPFWARYRREREETPSV